MVLEDFAARFAIAVEDLSGVWESISEVVQERLPLRNIVLRNKFGNGIAVNELQVQYLLSTDARFQRLQPHAHSPVTWFRNPYAYLILVAHEDVDEYKRVLRPQLRSLLERDKDPLGGVTEWVICYIRPAGADPLSKGARKVFETLRHDFNTRRRERCVRLDLPSARGRGSVAGMDDLERQLKDAVKASFEARAAAYDEEVRKLMAGRLDPGWSFSTLFLVKDSLAIMLEAAGLLEEALREYFELEACYLEGLAEGGALAGRDFGGTSDGDDVAELLKATWRETRRSVLHSGGLAEFHFRQYLFACQARVLLKLGRPEEVADRGLKFVQTFTELLDRREKAGRLPPLFRQAWAFSACLSLATTAARHHQALKPQAPEPAAPPEEPDAAHRRTTSFDEQPGDGGRQSAKMTRSYSANDLAESADNKASVNAHGSSPDLASKVSSQSETATTGDQGLSNGPGLESCATRAPSQDMLLKRISLKRLKVLSNNRAVSSDDSGSATPTEPPPAPPDNTTKPSQAALDKREQPRAARPAIPDIDWDLGVAADMDEKLALSKAGQRTSATAKALASTAATRVFYCLLGHLYASARLELMRMGHALGLSTDMHTSAMQQHGGSPVSSAMLDPANQQRRTPFGHMLAPAYSIDRASSTAILADAYKGAALLGTENAVSTPRSELRPREDPFGAARTSQSSAEAPPASRHRRNASAVLPGSSTPKKLSRFASSHLAAGSSRADMTELARAGASGISVAGSAREVESGGGSFSTQDMGSRHPSMVSTPGHQREAEEVAAEQAASEAGPSAEEAAERRSQRSDSKSEAADDTEPGQVDGTVGIRLTTDSQEENATDLQSLGPGLAPMGSVVGSLDSLQVMPSGSMPDADGIFDSSDPRFIEREVETASEASETPRSHKTDALARTASQQLSDAEQPVTPKSELRAALQHEFARAAAEAEAAEDAEAGAVPAAMVSTAAGRGTDGSSDAGTGPTAAARSLFRQLSNGGDEGPAPQWISDWRLKLALSCNELHQELWMALSNAAAACYSTCGRKRNGALMRADVAEALLKRGQTARAAAVIERQCQLFLEEGWRQLAAVMLPRLLACQQALAQLAQPHTCLQLLSLPASVWASLDRAALQRSLIQSAAVACPPPASSSSQDASLYSDTQGVLYVQPVSDSYSRFFGQPFDALVAQSAAAARAAAAATGSKDAPVSSAAVSRATAAWQMGEGKSGAQDISVGDVVTVTVEVVSMLPEPLVLEDVCLSLALLQEVAVAYSPRSQSKDRNDLAPGKGSSGGGMNAGAPSLGLARVSADSALETAVPSADGVRRSADVALGQSSSKLGASAARFGTRWQETEELTCTPVATPSPKEADGKPGHASQQLVPALPTAQAMTVSGQSVTLHPGINALTFQASPLKRGLYAIKCLQGRLLRLPLRLPLVMPGAHGPVFASSASSAAASRVPAAMLTSEPSSKSLQAFSGALGSVDSAGCIREDPVVLRVQSCQRRLAVSAVVPNGVLVAGQAQWLGVAVEPRHDEPQRACMQIIPAQPAAADSLAALTSITSVSSPTAVKAAAAAAQHGGLGIGLQVAADQQAFAVPLRLPVRPPAPTAKSRSPLPPPPVAMPAPAVAASSASSGRAAVPETALAATPAESEAAALAAPQRQEATAAQLTPLTPPSGSGQFAAGAAGAASNAERDGSPSNGGQASTSGRTDGGAGDWVTLQGQELNLPPWAAHQASLVWVWVQTGPAAVQHDVVRVTPPSGRAFVRMHSGQNREASGGAAAPTAGESVEVDVNVEYLAGCQRSHAARLAVPVTPPFRISLSARETGDKRVALQLQASSNLVYPVLIHSARVTPQQGFALEYSLAEMAGMLPLLVPPGSSTALAFFLTSQARTGGTRATHSRSAGSSVSILELEIERAPAEPLVAPPLEVKSEWGEPVLGAYALPVPPPPPELGTRSLLRHTCTLELAPDEGTPRSTVYVRLLGPFTAKLGVAVSLCWRLERSEAFVSKADAEVIQYEVQAEGDSWHPASQRCGCVGLPVRGGATATVEAAWLPTSLGMLPMPELHLRDVAHKEVFDVGSGNEFINVIA